MNRCLCALLVACLAAFFSARPAAAFEVACLDCMELVCDAEPECCAEGAVLDDDCAHLISLACEPACDSREAQSLLQGITTTSADAFYVSPQANQQENTCGQDLPLPDCGGYSPKPFNECYRTIDQAIGRIQEQGLTLDGSPKPILIANGTYSPLEVNAAGGFWTLNASLDSTFLRLNGRTSLTITSNPGESSNQKSIVKTSLTIRKGTLALRPMRTMSIKACQSRTSCPMNLSSYCPGGTEEVNMYPYPHISVITKKSNAFDFGNVLTLMEIKGDPSWNDKARWYPKNDTTLGPIVAGSNPKLVEIKSGTLNHLRCQLCCAGIDVDQVPSGTHGWHVSVPDSWVEDGHLRNHPQNTIHDRRAHFQTTSDGSPKPSHPEWRWYMQVDQEPERLYELAEAPGKCACGPNPSCNQ